MALTSRKKEFNFFELYEHFITDSKKGKRLQPNGKKLSAGTIVNYGYTLQLLKKFSEEKKFSSASAPENPCKAANSLQKKTTGKNSISDSPITYTRIAGILITTSDKTSKTSAFFSIT